MDSKSSGSLGIKSSPGRDLRNAPPVQESAQVSASGTGPDVGPAGFSVTERSAPGYEGPGVGSAKKMSDENQAGQGSGV